MCSAESVGRRDFSRQPPAFTPGELTALGIVCCPLARPPPLDLRNLSTIREHASLTRTCTVPWYVSDLGGEPQLPRAVPVVAEALVQCRQGPVRGASVRGMGSVIGSPRRVWITQEARARVAQATSVGRQLLGAPERPLSHLRLLTRAPRPEPIDMPRLQHQLDGLSCHPDSHFLRRGIPRAQPEQKHLRPRGKGH